MRVLQINSVANNGSTGRISEEIGKLISLNGHESYIAYGRRNAISASKLIKIGSKFEVYLHGITTLITDKHCLGISSFFATKKFIRIIENINPDIIHIHNLHGYYINIEILFNYLSSKSIPIVWTLHDCWSFTGHCSHFETSSCEKWKTQCIKCPSIRSYPMSLFYDRSEKNFIKKRQLFCSINNIVIIPVSFWLGNLVKSSYLSNFRIKVIQNGIDIKAFKPYTNALDIKKKFGINNKLIILGVAGVWSKTKGLDDFIKIASLISKDKTIMLVGLSERQTISLPKNIVGIKKTECIAALAQIYSSADIYLNLTYADTFPTTNIEALACGTPVLTYRTGGSVEAINEEVGWVVEKGDINGVLNIINKIDHKDNALISKCRQWCVNNYNNEIKFKEYLNLYMDLTKK